MVSIAFASSIMAFRWFGTSFNLWLVPFIVTCSNSTHELSTKEPIIILNTTVEPPPKPRMICNTSARYYTKDISNCWTDGDYILWKQGDFHLPGPSRLFFVGESSSGKRIPVYDVVEPRTPRPVNRGLAVVFDILKKVADGPGVEWIMVMDDETFVSPPNLELLLLDYDHQQPLMIGQVCQDRLCGGACYVFSRALFEKCPPFIVLCHRTPRDPYSDVTVPRCITAKTGVRPTDRKEFNSQPPQFYTSLTGLDDRPQGYGRAVTFHYITPAVNYLSLWRLHQAYYENRT
ncbi:unnamed protein product [Rotaria sp. Silwood2]|nr:unnamed protein product [Rotaria sp. Silwood2]CAF3082109.1 unnamed protein product [Rotaria sp. Silwood2]CAF3468079.1 unnamed protein product [Rotaria sp. Silwood2]CAF4389453.1 unnamed protein product [Rotaria sp. Silwood2]CAF4532768.1 unnamed protein product [Rotaria sp. Silwood2]